MKRQPFKKGDRLKCIEGAKGLRKNALYVAAGDESQVSGFVQVEALTPMHNDVDGEYYAFRFELADAKPLGKLLGYKLLKDLPDLKAGALITHSRKARDYPWVGPLDKSGTGVNMCAYTEETVLNTDWFEPVYEPEDITLKLKDSRKAVISKGGITLVNDKGEQEIASHEYVIQLYEAAQAFQKANKYKHFAVELLTMQVGCWEFDMLELQEVYNAVKRVNA